MKLYYVTSNVQKFEEARLIFQSAPTLQIELLHSPIHLDELQGTAKAIIEHKAIQARDLLKSAVVVDDVSVSLEALHGLPGPYIRPFLEALGDTGFWELVQKYDTHRMSATCHIGFAQAPDFKAPDSNIQIFESTLQGTIVSPRGSTRHGTHSWNAFTLPDGFSKTLAEMTLEEISRISPRGHALRSLKNYLLNNRLATSPEVM